MTKKKAPQREGAPKGHPSKIRVDMPGDEEATETPDGGVVTPQSGGNSPPPPPPPKTLPDPVE